jgi:hypothetical protein
VQADAKGVVNNPSSAIRNGFTKSAKPYAVRSGGSSSRSGFSGGEGQLVIRKAVTPRPDWQQKAEAAGFIVQLWKG